MTDSREVLLMISKDMADDAKAFWGRPFNGATVGEALGNLQAAVARMAEILAEMQAPEGGA
jgi:hypothetical protein